MQALKTLRNLLLGRIVRHHHTQCGPEDELPEGLEHLHERGFETTSVSPNPAFVGNMVAMKRVIRWYARRALVCSGKERQMQLLRVALVAKLDDDQKPDGLSSFCQTLS